MSDRRRPPGPGAAPDAAGLVYERYKDALRRGHVAALHGAVDEAVAAYEEAARIAPHRPMARASAGLALARAGRHGEAIPAFDAALHLAPRDEATRAGRAEALEAVGRRLEAAADLDVVAEVREGDGRLAEALGAAGRALELAEARHRRATVRRLVDALAGSELDGPARVALEGAMRVLESGAGDAPVTEGVTHDDARPGEAPEDGEATTPAPSAGEAEPAGEGHVASDAAALEAAAHAALDAGDGPTARQRLLELAAAHRGAGRSSAALDACYLALAVAPDDIDLHLALAAIYEERGWSALAAEKRELLARLAALDGDDAAAERVARASATAG